MQTAIQIGVLTLTIDSQQRNDKKFLDAFDACLQWYCECDSDQRQMTVSQLIKIMKGVVADNDGLGRKFPIQWFYGFTLGWITGLNNPDIANDDPSLSYTESLIRKHLPLYRDLALKSLEPTAEEVERVSTTELFPVAVLQET